MSQSNTHARALTHTQAICCQLALQLNLLFTFIMQQTHKEEFCLNWTSDFAAHSLPTFEKFNRCLLSQVGGDFYLFIFFTLGRSDIRLHIVGAENKSAEAQLKQVSVSLASRQSMHITHMSKSLLLSLLLLSLMPKSDVAASGGKYYPPKIQ